VNDVLKLLVSEGFAEKDASKIYVTSKGLLASHLREAHCLVFANFVEKGIFDDLTSKQMVSIFSCFTNITVSEEFKSFTPYSEDKKTQEIVNDIQNMYEYYKKKEFELKMNTGVDYTVHFDLMSYIHEWCDCLCVEDCKFFLQKLEKEKEIFLGEFSKALLKINNISNEMEKIADMTGNIAFLSKLREIPNMTLKYVVTNQSLYV
jgi:superfamily II RNA helicase